ncbi:hypothetical protein K438DRAFT_1782907 [Mycena galopus ATCC 62051]|nr:hypothetical protein K438DRAFT_1782907 [Mycena galopus ATCC 62051]
MVDGGVLAAATTMDTRVDVRKISQSPCGLKAAKKNLDPWEDGRRWDCWTTRGERKSEAGREYSRGEPKYIAQERTAPRMRSRQKKLVSRENTPDGGNVRRPAGRRKAKRVENTSGASRGISHRKKLRLVTTRPRLRVGGQAEKEIFIIRGKQVGRTGMLDDWREGGKRGFGEMHGASQLNRCIERGRKMSGAEEKR